MRMKRVSKPRLAHLRLLGQEALAPAAQRLGVVAAEGQFVDDFQAGRCGRPARGTRGAGQQAAGEDVLLDEVGART
jgi:hypothetical protein